MVGKCWNPQCASIGEHALEPRRSLPHQCALDFQIPLWMTSLMATTLALHCPVHTCESAKVWVFNLNPLHLTLTGSSYYDWATYQTSEPWCSYMPKILSWTRGGFWVMKALNWRCHGDQVTLMPYPSTQVLVPSPTFVHWRGCTSHAAHCVGQWPDSVLSSQPPLIMVELKVPMNILDSCRWHATTCTCWQSQSTDDIHILHLHDSHHQSKHWPHHRMWSCLGMPHSIWTAHHWHCMWVWPSQHSASILWWPRMHKPQQETQCIIYFSSAWCIYPFQIIIHPEPAGSRKGQGEPQHTLKDHWCISFTSRQGKNMSSHNDNVQVNTGRHFPAKNMKYGRKNLWSHRQNTGRGTLTGGSMPKPMYSSYSKWKMVLPRIGDDIPSQGERCDHKES